MTNTQKQNRILSITKTQLSLVKNELRSNRVIKEPIQITEAEQAMYNWVTLKRAHLAKVCDDALREDEANMRRKYRLVWYYVGVPIMVAVICIALHHI